MTVPTVEEMQTEHARLIRERDTAYDGISKRRSRRALKPLERDILVRIIGEILYEVEYVSRREGRTTIRFRDENETCGMDLGGLIFLCGQHILRLDMEEIQILRDIRKAINPRPDGE